MEALEPLPLFHPQTVVAVGKEVGGSCVGWHADPLGGVDGDGLDAMAVVYIYGFVGDDDHASVVQLHRLEHAVAAQSVLSVEGVVAFVFFCCMSCKGEEQEQQEEECRPSSARRQYAPD